MPENFSPVETFFTYWLTIFLASREIFFTGRIFLPVENFLDCSKILISPLENVVFFLAEIM